MVSVAKLMLVAIKRRVSEDAMTVVKWYTKGRLSNKVSRERRRVESECTFVSLKGR
jgi:hypothetical protein